MRLETRPERDERQRTAPKLVHVPGRSLPVGYQWTGRDMAGRGKAAARRLRQIAKQAEKVAAV